MTKRLIMCQGLPGSGKSTWARDQIALFQCSTPVVEARIVNKDSIRHELELTGWTWSRENEAQVVAIRDSRITNAFATGAEVVISDDTNFGRYHRNRLRQLAQEAGATFAVHSMHAPPYSVTVDECIRRDTTRSGKQRVGPEVIRAMAAKYGIQDAPVAPLPVLQDDNLMPAIICDLDGTLCLLEGRNPYDASTCDLDGLNRPVRKLLEVFYRFMNYQILYVSGRHDTYRPQTETFFRKHHVPPGPLFMRAAGDMRKDSIVKGEIFDAHIRGKYNVLFVLDDRDQVVKFWRSIGLTCFQVAEGDF